MASAAVLFASQAMAQDLTGAFSVPGKGQIMSETTLGMTRTKMKYSNPLGIGSMSYIRDGAYATENLEYGLTDNWSVNAGISNAFDVDSENLLYGIEGITYNNSHNFAYNLGAKYNTRFDDVLFQVAASYNTWNPKTWYGKHSWVSDFVYNGRWQKNLGLDLKAGLDLGNGITPYAVYHIDSDIDVAHRALTQSVSLGVHKYAGKWALDGALRYEWTKGYNDILNMEAGFEGIKKKNTTETWLDVAADYYLKDNVALGLYGSYLIDSHDRTYREPQGESFTEHKNFDYELGLRVKVLF